MAYQQLSIVWICKKLNSTDISLIEKENEKLQLSKSLLQRK